MNLKKYIAEYPDFPKQGIDFKDISPLLASPEAFSYAVDELSKICENADKIVGLDARGFIFGAAVAVNLGIPFVMIRKKGKLPGECISIDYGLEYGNDSLELQKSSVKDGEKICLIDDLLATGGTLGAATKLIESRGATVQSIACVIALNESELIAFDSRRKIEAYNIHSLIEYS